MCVISVTKSRNKKHTDNVDDGISSLDYQQLILGFLSVAII